MNAYWLHTTGAVIEVPTIHIAEVIKNPARFGCTPEQIIASYRRHNEPVGHEGKARQEIMADLIRFNGWIRLRYTPATDFWVVELNSLTDELRLLLRSFFSDQAITGRHPQADICIIELSGIGMSAQHRTSVSNLTQGVEEPCITPG